MKTKKNALEWAVFAVSALLVIATVGVLLDAALDRKGGPAELRVSLDPPKKLATGEHLVHLRVRNGGGRTAAEATIEVTLESNGRRIERAELKLPYIPANSERQGSVLFRNDPSCCAISARPLSFQDP